jgi:hypothetical protein
VKLLLDKFGKVYGLKIDPSDEGLIPVYEADVIVDQTEAGPVVRLTIPVTLAQLPQLYKVDEGT